MSLAEIKAAIDQLSFEERAELAACSTVGRMMSGMSK
jgi:hypothetical protein